MSTRTFASISLFNTCYRSLVECIHVHSSSQPSELQTKGQCLMHLYVAWHWLWRSGQILWICRSQWLERRKTERVHAYTCILKTLTSLLFFCVWPYASSHLHFVYTYRNANVVLSKQTRDNLIHRNVFKTTTLCHNYLYFNITYIYYVLYEG